MRKPRALVIHIQATPQDKGDFRYYLSRRENVEPVESALYQRLTEFVQNRLSPEAFESDLDPEILALLVEEEPESVSEDFVQDIPNGNLVTIQAKRKPYTMEPLNQVFIRVAKNVIKHVPEPEYRAVYSTTGLSTDILNVS